jgi:BirA family biotin operon repressor/biotin-[acetyl-CoA-carboxylase] ligase
VQGLAAWDVAVATRRGFGYRLSEPLDLLDAARLRDLLGPTPGRDVEVFDTLASTNAHLVARIAAGRGAGVCLAEHQSAGRGRRGRTWHSPFGRNLYLSISHAFDVGPAQLAGLSLAVGAALVQVLRGLGVDGIGIKWPNDLVSGRHKLGGILIELQGDTQGPCWAVVGIGLDVNMSAAGDGAIDQPWTSLARLAGRVFDRTALAAQVIAAVHDALVAFPASGLAPWLAQYAAADVLAGHEIDVDWAGEHLHGVARGIDAQGALLIDCDGVRRPLWGGEVTVRAGRGPAA